MRATFAIILTTLFPFHHSASGFHSPPSTTYHVRNALRRGGRRGATSLNSSHNNLSPDNNADQELPSSSSSSHRRRLLLGRALSTSFAGALSLFAVDHPSVASAKVVSAPLSPAAAASSSTPERDALLRAIADKSSDEIVMRAIERLVPSSPLKGDGSADDKSSYASALDGEWKLLWYNKSDFSPLLKLPSPLRPDSYQYFGSVAEREVGEGRVAQGLVGGVLNVLGPEKELWLSSGAVPREGRPSTLEIYPPFRFQLGGLPGSRAEKRTIVESQSDAEFRAANARSTEAQLAPKNEYEQLYLENLGRGSLRVSVVAVGDPVIVGDMFVHQKL